MDITVFDVRNTDGPPRRQDAKRGKYAKNLNAGWRNSGEFLLPLKMKFSSWRIFLLGVLASWRSILLDRRVALVTGTMLALFGLKAPAHADDFADHVDLTPLRIISVQDNQTMKTLDTLARQVISQITGHGSIDGHDALFTMLDMSFRPENYVDRNIIKIVNVPLRQEFLNLSTISSDEQDRIVKEGTVSLNFLSRPEVADLLQRVQAESVAKSKAIDQVMMAESAMEKICVEQHGFIPAAMIPPAVGSTDPNWHMMTDLVGNDPDLVAVLQKNGGQVPAAVAGYENQSQLIQDVFAAGGSLFRGWSDGDADLTNSSAEQLAGLLPKINPDVYPSAARRTTEVIYNRLMKLTIPGSAFYFVAFVLFLMSAQSGLGKLRLWGLRFMVVALLVHSTGIAVRWWLVGGIFPPIKNEFESVMFSAWFGAMVGLILELRKSRGMFGAAASFVGFLSLGALFCVPYVTGTEIGGEIGQVQGILMSYWLYIHVTMVTAAYSLISMGFLLSAWWLVLYYSNKKKGGGSEPPTPSGSRRMAVKYEPSAPAGGGAATLSFVQTLGMMFFFPQPRKAVAIEQIAPRDFPDALDQCNLVVLQLAFWVLGAGIMFGAIWADQSWGRPWGWDPKETFALVTWIVYLIVVHIRVATVNKAWWTAVLSCIGFFVMLFNWIGVNFLLVGLHSYA
jgi:cytochrome c-type biogenesis protein CcsB